MRLAASLAAIIIWLVAFAAPSPAGAVAVPPAGDVDCNGTTNAIDAALILQLDAAIVDALACEENGDVNEDGAINSIDAFLTFKLFIAPL